MVTDYYSLFDKVSDSFRPPFSASSEAVAVRLLRHSLMESRGLALHADDLTLMHVGAWDDSAGCFIPVAHRVISSVSAIVAQIPKEVVNEKAN